MQELLDCNYISKGSLFLSRDLINSRWKLTFFSRFILIHRDIKCAYVFFLLFFLPTLFYIFPECITFYQNRRDTGKKKKIE